MADWYASSVAYAAVPQWAATTAYTVGQFVRSLAAPSQAYHYYVHRCTTAGTTAGTEPGWAQADGSTTTSGTATFTNVTGRSAYGWSAATGMLVTLSNVTGNVRPVIGDRVFISSDHNETNAYNTLGFIGGSANWGSLSIISVNRAGSVPPVAADISPGAVLNFTASTFFFENITPVLYQGITFNLAAANAYLNSSSGTKSFYFKDCAIVLTKSDALARFISNAQTEVIFDNTTFRVSHVNSNISAGPYSMAVTWLNTLAAVQGATLPAALFYGSDRGTGQHTLRGVDLSALVGTILGSPTNPAWGPIKLLLDECRIAPAVTRMYTPAAANMPGDVIELINCFDGTNVLNERHRSAGSLTFDRSTVMSGGATDGSGAFSFKMVSSSRADKFVEVLDSFFLDVENLAIGSAKTATVEILSSATLNVDDVFLSLEHLGTASSTLAQYVSSKPSSLSSTALPTSAVTWLNPPGTPVKQYLQATFTPLTAGRVRGRVQLGKPSTTIWVNPQIAIAAAPVTWDAATGTNMTLSNGNLTAAATINAAAQVRATLSRTTGKYYFEALSAGTLQNSAVGISTSSPGGSTLGPALSAYINFANGALFINGSSLGNIFFFTGPIVAGDTICVAIDLTNKRIWFRRNALAWNDNGANNPATNAGGYDLSTVFASAAAFPVVTFAGTGFNHTANFGATAFAQTVPSGFSAWNS